MKAWWFKWSRLLLFLLTCHNRMFGTLNVTSQKDKHICFVPLQHILSIREVATSAFNGFNTLASKISFETFFPQRCLQSIKFKDIFSSPPSSLLISPLPPQRGLKIKKNITKILSGSAQVASHSALCV